MNIKIPLPQKISVNEIYSSHWRKRQALTQVYYQSLIEHRNKIIIDYPVDITCIFSFKGRLLDVDNCVGMAKKLIDGLRHWHIIENDDPTYIQSLTLMSQKGKKDEVEIIIT